VDPPPIDRELHPNALHFRAGPGDVAGGVVIGRQLVQLGRDLVALVDRQRAAPAEPAAGHRVDHPRRLAAVGLGADRQRRARVGHGREQQLGVGVPRAGQHLLDGPGSAIWPAYMTISRSAT
jgi:hypothetical protein